MLPGGASTIELQQADPIDQASEADYYRTPRTFYPDSNSAAINQQSFQRPYQSEIPVMPPDQSTSTSAGGLGAPLDSTFLPLGSKGVPQKKKHEWVFEKHPVPWLNALGRGARGVGRGAIHSAENTSNFVSSPEFINAATGLAAMGGVVYGLSRINRSNGPNSVAQTQPRFVSGHTCAFPSCICNPNCIGPNPNSHIVGGWHQTVANNSRLDNYSSPGAWNPWTGKRTHCQYCGCPTQIIGPF